MRGLNSEHLSNLGVALPPGPPFVGGSNLVVWKRVAGEARDVALSWIAHLVSPRVQMAVSNAAGLLPVLKDVLDDPVYNEDPHYSVFKRALETGRALANITKWGGTIEEELVRAVGGIWGDIKDDPRVDVPSTVLRYLSPVAKHSDAMLRNGE